MTIPRLADLRNVYAAEEARAAGFAAYASVGRTGFPDAPDAARTVAETMIAG